jgi:hypothetical protein
VNKDAASCPGPGSYEVQSSFNKDLPKQKLKYNNNLMEQSNNMIAESQVSMNVSSSDFNEQHLTDFIEENS